MANVREVALDTLINVSKNNAYSNLELNKVIKENHISALDRGLLTELVYGTIQWEMTLDYRLSPFLKGKTQDWVRQLLRMSVYQMEYLDKVPDHAVIHEAVNLAKKHGHKGISSMVNGVLRNVQRSEKSDFSEISNPVERLSIETSHPKWLVEKLIEQYGFDTTREICFKNQEAPVQFARVNTVKSDAAKVIQMLAEEHFTFEQSELIPECVMNTKGNVANSQGFKEGFITVQDLSSMIVANVLNPTETDTVLDTCAAPGGKTTHIAEKMNNEGKIVAFDIHKHKLKLISATAKRLGHTNIEAVQLDARKVSEMYEEETFDKVLVDAPCSGLGVLRRKPEAKYMKTAKDIENLSNIQLGILEKVAPYVKKGGELVYSTCTINKAENEEVAEKFLAQNPAFVACGDAFAKLHDKIQNEASGHMIQVLPQHFNSDGFFVAKFIRKG